MKITCYVDACGDLVTMDTDDRLRPATPAERRESAWSVRREGGTGAIEAEVSNRTVRRCAPHLLTILDGPPYPSTPY